MTNFLTPSSFSSATLILFILGITIIDCTERLLLGACKILIYWIFTQVIINKTGCQRHHRGFPKRTKNIWNLQFLCCFCITSKYQILASKTAAWPCFFFPLFNVCHPVEFSTFIMSLCPTRLWHKKAIIKYYKNGFCLGKKFVLIVFFVLFVILVPRAARSSLASENSPSSIPSDTYLHTSRWS